MIKINGVALEVQRVESSSGGQRSPIVFLHEGLGSVAMWRDWPSSVCEATGRAGIVYSRRGYGASDPIPDVRGTGRAGADYMHREAIDVLPELLAHAGIEYPVLLGHSDGGTIALIHAAHFPVRACIVMAPHVMVEEVSVTAIEQAREQYETSGLRDRLSKYHTDVDNAFWQWNDVWLSPQFREFDIRSECRRIQAPVLAIQGDQDPYGTVRQIEEIEPLKAPVRREVLHGCGHSPHRDAPEATLKLISEFLAEME